MTPVTEAISLSVIILYYFEINKLFFIITKKNIYISLFYKKIKYFYYEYSVTSWISPIIIKFYIILYNFIYS